MKFIFVSLPTFEYWDWRNPDTQGIGGSETSHIEMCARLAKRGHEVISFAPIPDYDQNSFTDLTVWGPEGVAWRSTGIPGEALNERLLQFTDRAYVQSNAAIWVVYRAPEVVDFIPQGQPIWHIYQDVDYPSMTPERAAKYTRHVALCSDHAAYLRRNRRGVCVSSNGIKSELIREIAKNPPVRNPKRLIYASSPDRGLLNLVPIFQRAQEIIPDLELHVYYGLNNIDVATEQCGGELSGPGKMAQKIRRALEGQPGIHWHGRTAQPTLLREWFKAGIWCHPSNFTETSCITCMDAQACGAVPITTPIWAIGENVQHGVFIDGNPDTDAIVKARYVHELVTLASQPDLQEEYRRSMMPWARTWFDWEHWVDQWESWGEQDWHYARLGNEASDIAFREKFFPEARTENSDTAGTPRQAPTEMNDIVQALDKALQQSFPAGVVNA